jgi:putative acetyltransferase
MINISQVVKGGNELNTIRQLFRDYENELGENLCFQSFEEELNNPLQKYAEPRGVIFLAHYNNEVAGCIALYELNEDECEMKRLYVKPEFRKHKIAQQLVDKLIEHAKQQGFKKMKLDTLEKLQPAIGLYRKNGFDETTAYYENPLPTVVYMEKLL